MWKRKSVDRAFLGWIDCQYAHETAQRKPEETRAKKGEKTWNLILRDYSQQRFNCVTDIFIFAFVLFFFIYICTFLYTHCAIRSHYWTIHIFRIFFFISVVRSTYSKQSSQIYIYKQKHKLTYKLFTNAAQTHKMIWFFSSTLLCSFLVHWFLVQFFFLLFMLMMVMMTFFPFSILFFHFIYVRSFLSTYFVVWMCALSCAFNGVIEHILFFFYSFSFNFKYWIRKVWKIRRKKGKAFQSK